MHELIQSIDSLLAKVAQKTAIKEGMEWYLKNNLNDYKAVMQSHPSARDIENATRALTRFCTESMDWDDPLYRECCAITEQGMKLAKKYD